MRILLIVSRYLPHRGGLESVAYHLAHEFYRQGHTVQIITNRYPRTLPAREELDGLQVIRLHFLLPDSKYLHNSRFDLWLAGIWYCFYTERVLRRIINEFQPDVVNNHYLNEVAEFTDRSLASRSPSIPWVISLHGGDVDGEPFMGKSKMERFRRLSRFADGLTACSGFLAMQAVELEPAIANKIQVIHNGVDVDLFSKARSLDCPSPYIFALGQLVQHKGFDVLIDAFAFVSKKYSEVNLIIAGEGEFRSELERHIKENGLERRVTLMGKVDSAKAASLIAGGLFIAMPSRREPFGIVALEGMAAGKCVLATPVGGIPEFLPCPPNQMVVLDIDKWVRALDDWIGRAEDGQLDGSENRIVAQRYDWSSVAQKYLMVYQQVLAS